MSTLHAVIITIGSLVILTDGNLAHDRVFGYSPYAANIYSISCGQVVKDNFISRGKVLTLCMWNRYFVWDVITAILYIKNQGISMVCHGVAAFLVLFLSYVSMPSIMYGSFLLPCWILDHSSVPLSTITEQSSCCTKLVLHFWTSIGSWYVSSSFGHRNVMRMLMVTLCRISLVGLEARHNLWMVFSLFRLSFWHVSFLDSTWAIGYGVSIITATWKTCTSTHDVDLYNSRHLCCQGFGTFTM